MERVFLPQDLLLKRTRRQPSRTGPVDAAQELGRTHTAQLLIDWTWRKPITHRPEPAIRETCPFRCACGDCAALQSTTAKIGQVLRAAG